MPENHDIELRSEEVQEVMNRIPPVIQHWGITVLALIVAIFFAIAYFVKIPVTQECSFTIYSTAEDGKSLVIIIIPASAIQSIISNDRTEVRLYSELFPDDYQNGIAVVVSPTDIKSLSGNKFEASVRLPAEAERTLGKAQLSISGTANIVTSHKTLLDCLRLPVH